MPEYRLTWEIDLEADSVHDAARKALEIQRDPDSVATVFSVQYRYPDGHLGLASPVEAAQVPVVSPDVRVDVTYARDPYPPVTHDYRLHADDAGRLHAYLEELAR